MTQRYPELEPFNVGMLEVGDGHSLYYEEVGSQDGIPALYLHGGPGSGCSVGARRNFNPQVYRAILVDQRGCGRSRPLASDLEVDLSTNTTHHLIGDIEVLRKHLGVEAWVIVGVSWGVTLGLVYAQRYPERVRAMVLGAIIADPQREVRWITHDMGRLFPREWERFTALLAEDERYGNIAAGYARLLADPNPDVRERAAYEWCLWEDTHVSLMPGWQPNPRYQDPDFRMVFARLVTHYWRHTCFLQDGEIMANILSINHIPAVLIHGRYDISGPLDIAWELHKAWSRSDLVVLEDAGHGGLGFPEAMTTALNKLSHSR